MGGGGSAALADIYLFSYEYRNKFNNELIYMRYVDDILWALRSNDITTGFEFYPDYLRFVETECDESGGINFLDLTLRIVNKKIMTCIYDKRNGYKFETNRVMKWNSSVHISIYRNIIAGYIDRCVKLNSDPSWTAECIRDFKNRLLLSEYPVNFVNCCLEACASQLEC
jgi:ribosomal protein S17E